MSISTKSGWFRRLGIAGVAALSLGVLALPTAPAKAQIWVSVGAPGWGYAPYYSPYRYGYPYYGYGAPGIWFRFGGHHHGHWHHHHHH